MTKIERTRYVVVRHTDGAIMCGTSRVFQFKQPSKIGKTPIKTYSSAAKALAAARIAFEYDETFVYAERVTETITSF